MALFEGKRVILLIVFGLAAVALIVTAVWFFTDILSSSSNRNVETILLEVDDNLQNGFFSNAEDKLQTFYNFSGSATQWIAILDRAFQLGENTEDYSTLLKLSRSAIQDIPANEKLWAVAIFAELQNGLYAKAYDHSINKLQSGSYPELETEAYLRNTDAEILPPTPYADIIIGFKERDPLAFERAEEITDDERFRILTVLLYMHHGKIDRAYSLIETVPFDKAPNLLFYIAMDAHQTKAASEYLVKLQEKKLIDPIDTLFLRADITMINGEKKEAFALYKKIIEIAPQNSWIPYLNCTWLSETENNGGGFSYILEAYSIFPEKKDVILPLAWYLMEKSNPEAAKERLYEYLVQYPEDPDIELLYATVSSSMVNPARYKAILWQLYNRYPKNVTIAQYLCWYLFGIEDYPGLEEALQQFEKNGGRFEWILFLRGALYAAQGKYDQAEENFEESLTVVQRWESHYNLGLIGLARGFLDTALERYQKAEQMIKRGNVSREVLKNQANIYIKIATIHYLNGNYEEAGRHLAYGLEMDSHNLEGRLLVKKLEAAEKR